MISTIGGLLSILTRKFLQLTIYTSKKTIITNVG